MVLMVWLGLGGCAEPPVFVEVEEVIVHTQTKQGTDRVALSGDKLWEARLCLYETTEVGQSQMKPEVLQEIILLQVKDRLGDRMFEFITDENLTGNKGKHYRNPCIFRVVKTKDVAPGFVPPEF